MKNSTDTESDLRRGGVCSFVERHKGDPSDFILLFIIIGMN
jgi:hypothetical protein